jgi:hypothetical protein
MAPRFFVLLAASLTLCLPFGGLAQNAKPAPDNPDLIAADQLYKAGKFAEAAQKYQALPDDNFTQEGVRYQLLCVNEADYNSARGDSGSPVFVITSQDRNEVTFIGMNSHRRQYFLGQQHDRPD